MLYRTVSLGPRAAPTGAIGPVEVLEESRAYLQDPHSTRDNHIEKVYCMNELASIH